MDVIRLFVYQDHRSAIFDANFTKRADSAKIFSYFRFAALAIAGISIAGTAQFVPGPFAPTVLVAIGSATFGAGLAFFLVRISALTDK